MQVTTTDQATAEVSKEKEPLRTLQTFRKGSILGWTRVSQWKAGVFFGMPSPLLCCCLPSLRGDGNRAFCTRSCSPSVLTMESTHMCCQFP